MKIADFFQTTQEATPPPKGPVARSSMSVTSKTKIAPETANAAKPTQMTINLKLEKPDIILVEHMDNIDTNAIIVNVSINNVQRRKNIIFVFIFKF